jgi:uncharacterized protein (DUF362 family)
MHATDTAVPILAALEPIRKKQVLCICDAIYGIISGGPEGYPQIKPNTLLLSTDTVSLDRIGSNLLADNGMSKNKIPEYIYIAENTYKLGNSNVKNIELIKITN